MKYAVLIISVLYTFTIQCQTQIKIVKENNVNLRPLITMAIFPFFIINSNNFLTLMIKNMFTFFLLKNYFFCKLNFE